MFGGTGNTLINNSTINGPIGVQTDGNTTVINRGSIIGTGASTFAATMSNNNNVFVMEGPGAVLNGDIIAVGSNNTFRLAGSGSNSFNVGQIYASVRPLPCSTRPARRTGPSPAPRPMRAR